MPQKWKTVRIFASSTFRDMHAERDHLVRFVFPELKEKCRKHRVHLIDVDLRWGVTEADAQDGKALDICLDEIDTCRPYFLGLLGHLYGSIPPGETHSITAQEIFHGVLHNDIPKQVVDLRRIIEGKLEGKTLTNEQINCLVRCYQWDADKGKYLLRDDALTDELEIIQTVFEQYSSYQRDRSFFFFRSKSLTKKLVKKKIDEKINELTEKEKLNQDKLADLQAKIKDDFFEKEKLNQDKLADLKQEIINAELSYFKYDQIEAFGKKVREVLWEHIETELGELSKEEKDWLDEEAEFHELFVADRTWRFVGRRKLLDRMHGFCEKDGEPSVMLIAGEPGCGKSALMGKFTTEVLHNHPGWLILPHFIGASPDSTSLRQTLKRLCTYLHRQLNIDDEVPEDIKELKQIFPDWIEKAAEQRRILIILDAVNQFEKADNAHNVQWLPQKLPDNVRFVVSTLAGKAHDALMVRRDKPKVVPVVGLGEKEIKKLVHDYLKEIRKDFPNEDDEKAFYDKIKLGNPLYILVALEELRVFGEFYKLADRIKQLPHNVPDLFDQVLKRIEDDFSKPLVRDCMILIACGRQGMAAQELQALLSAHAPQQDGIAPAEKLPDMIWARLYRAFSSYLFRRSDVIDFFHGQLKEAVGKRYLKDEVDRNATHKIIADYFEKRWREPYIRALEELPHQLTKASDWDGTERVLCDLQFVEAKCLAGMLFDIMQDLDRATGRKELISLFRMHKALSLSLPSLSARPELALQTVYNRLVWFDKLPPVLTKAVKNARTHLDTHYSWISAEAPIPGSQFQGTLSIQFDMQSSIQSLSPGSNSVAIASIEGYVEIRDLKYGELIETRKFNHSGITALALREDSTTMIYLDLDGIIQSEQEHKLLEGRRGEELIAYHSSAGVIAVQKNNSLVAYNPHINESTILADDLPVSLKVLRVTPDGQNILFVAGKKPQMRGVAKWTASGWNTVTQSYTGPPIIDADIDPEGRHVMFATQDRQIQIVEIETKSVVGQLFYQQRDEVIIHGKPIKGRFGVDDTKGWIFFATEPGQIACWNWEIDKVCRLEDYRQAVTDPVFLCLFEVMLSSGNLLMTTQSGVKIISKDFYHSNIKKHDAAIGDCVVTASGKVVSVSELDQSVRWFSAHGLNQLHAQSHRVPTSIAPCEESDDVIIGTGQGLVWKQPPDCEIKAKDIFMAFAEPVVSLFSVNSRTVIAAGKSGRVIRVNLSKDKVDVIWHSSGFQAQLKVLHAGRNGLFWSIYREEKADMHTIISLVHDIDKQTVILKDDKILNDIDVSRDGASLCIAAKSVRVLLKTHSGWETAYKRNTPVSHIAFLANGEMIAAVLWEKPWLEIWNVSEGLPTVATIDLPGNSSCISAKGNWIVAGFLSGDIVSMYFHEKG